MLEYGAVKNTKSPTLVLRTVINPYLTEAKFQSEVDSNYVRGWAGGLDPNKLLLVQTQFDKHSRLKRRKSAIINTLNSQTNGDEHDPGTFESARETVTNYPDSRARTNVDTVIK